MPTIYISSSIFVKTSEKDGYVLQEVKRVVMKMDSIKNYPENDTLQSKYLSKAFNFDKCHPAVKPCLNSDRDIPRISVENRILTGNEQSKV